MHPSMPGRCCLPPASSWSPRCCPAWCPRGGRPGPTSVPCSRRALPQVTAVTAAPTVPLGFGGSSDMSVTIDGFVPQPGEEIHAFYNQVAPRYFETMGISILRGRSIEPTDAADRPAVAVVNETMA